MTLPLLSTQKPRNWLKNHEDYFFLAWWAHQFNFPEGRKKGVLEGLVLKPFLLLHKGWDTFLISFKRKLVFLHYFVVPRSRGL